MPYTIQDLLLQSNRGKLTNFLQPPSAWESFSEATHWATIVPVEDINQRQLYRDGHALEDARALLRRWDEEEPDVLFELAESGELYSTNKCVSLYSILPYREEIGHDGSNLEVTDLGHKVLLEVKSERVGLEGGWHFVVVHSSNPDIDGKTGYVEIGQALK